MMLVWRQEGDQVWQKFGRNILQVNTRLLMELDLKLHFQDGSHMLLPGEWKQNFCSAPMRQHSASSWFILHSYLFFSCGCSDATSDGDEGSERSSLVASALATFFKQVGSYASAKSSVLDKWPTFVAKDKKSFFKLKSTKVRKLSLTNSVRIRFFVKLVISLGSAIKPLPNISWNINRFYHRIPLNYTCCIFAFKIEKKMFGNYF